MLVAATLLAPSPLRASSEDERFLDGLRARRLFSLAESYCRQRLADERLDDGQRARLAGELIRCYAGHALHAAPEQRARFWQLARETAEAFQRQHRDNPWTVLVRTQYALVVLARGELHRQEAEVSADPAAAREAAKAAIREAARLLEQLDQELERMIPLRRARRATAGGPSADELLSLQHHVRYQLARAYRNRALCYPPASEDRLAALTAAIDELKKPLALLAPDDPLVARVQIDLAACHRLLGNFAEAAQVLDSIDRTQPEPRVRLRARAEAARLRLDQGRPRAALEVLARTATQDGSTSPDLDFATLETYLALWKAAREAGDAREAKTWRDKAVALVERIESTHGRYWGRRSDLLLVKSIGARTGGAGADILERAADNLYRKDQFDDAIQAYQRAAEAALEAGDRDGAFRLRYKAALVEHTRGHHREASRLLRALGRDMSAHPKAERAHLLGAWNAAQWARTDPEGLGEYAQILEEHLRLWPEGKTAGTARLWLGRLRESQGDWGRAIEAYQAVPAADKSYEEAVRAAARCWNQRLASLEAAGSPCRDQAEAAAAWFEKQIAEKLQQPDRPWTALDRWCAEQAARFRLRYTPDGYAQAESVLRAALEGPPKPDPAWKSDAQALLVVALAGQPDQRAQARAVLDAIGAESPERLMEILDELAAIGRAVEARSRRDLAELQLTVLERLDAHRSQLDAAEQRKLRRIRAESLMLAGRRSEAVAAYAELAKEEPSNASVQEAYAQLLLDGPDEASWRAALAQWRRVARASRPRSERWYRAKYAVAVALFKLGQARDAAERIRYLQAVPPGLEDTPWEARFLELLRRCEAELTDSR